MLHFLSEMGKKLFARIREKDEKSIDKSKEKGNITILGQKIDL